MRRRLAHAAGLGLAVSVIGAVLWLAWPGATGQSKRSAADKIVAAPTEAAQGASPEGPPATTAIPSTPLPPDDAPLAGILPALAERADAGDRKAACRLSLELLRCSQLIESEAQAKRRAEPTEPTEPANAAASEWEARHRAWTNHWLGQCATVPESLRGQGPRYLRQAALAGEPEAMVRYAEGHQWPPSGRGALAGEPFDQWRREAPGMMQRALESGYAGAAFPLMVAYRDDWGFHAALVPDDDEQALTMSLLYARLYATREYPGHRHTLDAAAQLRARERAEAMHRRYFNGRQFSGRNPYPEPVWFPAQGTETMHSFCRDP